MKYCWSVGQVLDSLVNAAVSRDTAAFTRLGTGVIVKTILPQGKLTGCHEYCSMVRRRCQSPDILA